MVQQLEVSEKERTPAAHDRETAGSAKQLRNGPTGGGEGRGVVRLTLVLVVKKIASWNTAEVEE